MPEETPNHGLQEYSIGEEGWSHTPDMGTLEERLPVMFDERANRSNYEPYQGNFFWAVDTGEIFRGDGASWGDAIIDAADLRISGDAVATEAYVDNEISNVDGGGGGMEVHNNDYHEPNYASVTDLANHEGATSNVHGVGSDNVASQADIQSALDDHVNNYDHGSGGVTQSEMETYVDDEIGIHANVIDAHHTRYSDSEARTAVDGSSVSVSHATTADSADDATFWEGYELVFNNETPNTSQYIRFEEST